MEKHKARYLAAVSGAQSEGGLVALIGTASAVGDLRTMWVELAQSAPDDIRIDSESVSNAWLKQEENAASGDISGALATAILYSGSMGRVDAFARANCDSASAASAGSTTPVGAGIVLMDSSSGDVNLSVVDPTAGTVMSGPSWSASGDAAPSTSYAQMNNSFSFAYRSLFSADFSSIAATTRGLEGDANTSHVGWMDQDGTFTDVTAMTPAGDFASTHTDDTPAFDANGALWFARRENDDSMYKSEPQMMRYSPRDNAPAEVGEPLEDVNYMIVQGGNPRPMGGGSYTFATSTADGKMGCWGANDLVLDTCAALYGENQISIRKVYSVDTDDSKYMSPYGLTSDEGQKILPETNLDVSYPLISPDGSTVAFLADQPGSESERRLFTVPITGGEPQLVTTDQPITESMIPVQWR